MFKLRLAAAAAIACAVTLLSSGAQAYPDCGIDIDINPSSATLVGGKSFSFSVGTESEICDWTVTYRGQEKTKSQSTSISGSFSTPVVSKKTVNKLTASCLHDISDDASAAPAASGSTTVTPAVYSAGTSSAVQAPIYRTCSEQVDITLLPKGGVDNNDDGALPDTGGSNLWILVLGGALVVAGGGVTYAARRRHSAR